MLLLWAILSVVLGFLAFCFYPVFRLFILCGYFKVDIVSALSRDDLDPLYESLLRRIVEEAHLIAQRGLRLLERADEGEGKLDAKDRLRVLKTAEFMWSRREINCRIEIQIPILPVAFPEETETEKWKAFVAELDVYRARSREAVMKHIAPYLKYGRKK